ncbi:Transposon Tn7 transposition protein TnsB [Sporomusa rhizae]|uniref:Mu transposase C-terminal domain-containing protein n=1 Tax=Sporomusa rhizae TaxID=357999 RepID=UPI00352A5C5D
MLYANDIFKWADGTTERLLWTDGEIGYFINVLANKGIPMKKTISEYLLGIEEQRVIKVEQDPMARSYPEDKIPDNYKMVRSSAWEVIQELVSPQNEPEIYHRSTRGKLINQTAERHGVQRKTVYKYLRKYWQRGRTLNALLPDYFNSGANGKTRKAGEKKRGRPRKFKDSLGEGVNVTSRDIEKFMKALDKYYYAQKGYSPKEVYNLLLADFYSDDFRYNDQGVKLPVLKQVNNVPSLRQFLYWFDEKLDIERSLRSRKGDRNFELNERPILNSSAEEGLWATYKYQIDATIGDIYLRSAYNPNEIIGRPVIYFVIDVFSRMIVGYYVGLEGPSWIGMAMALANAMTDKVSFCAKYEKKITREEWACHFVPEALMCDRGEGESKSIETACHSLNIRIENAAPYRADWKGIVERYFRTTNEYIKRRVPGAVLPDFNTRMGQDYRLDAKLDLYDFNRLIIELILHYNNNNYMENYTRNTELIAEDVNPIPRELWNWSIKRSIPRVFDEKRIILSLMPRDTATVTADGIRFKKLLYTCEKAIREEWYLKANIKGSWKVNISYDPRNMNNLYIWNIGSSEFEICNLAPSQKNYYNQDLNELDYLFDLREYERTQLEQETRQSQSDLNAIVGHIIHEAKNKVPKTNKSKAAQVRNIRENRKNEKELNRKTEKFSLVPKEVKGTAEKSGSIDSIINLSPSKESIEKSYAFPKKLDLLKRKMRERKDGDK